MRNVEYRPGLKSSGVNYYDRPLKSVSERLASVPATLGGHVQRNLETRFFLSDIETSMIKGQIIQKKRVLFSEKNIVGPREGGWQVVSEQINFWATSIFIL